MKIEPSSRHCSGSSGRRAAYDAGATDGELAAREGVKPNTIVAWRHRAKLPCNPDPKAKRRDNSRRRFPSGRAYALLPLKHRPQAERLHRQGRNDYEIAEALGIAPEQVHEWRAAIGLPANDRKREVRLPPSISPMSDPLYAAVAAAIGRGLAADIREDAVSDMCIAVLEGTLDAADLGVAARQFRGSVLNRFASSFGPISLHEMVRGTDDLAIIDRIADDRSSGWLEEMGATVW